MSDTMTDTTDISDTNDILLPEGARVLHLTQVYRLKPADHILVRRDTGWCHGIFTGEKDGELWVVFREDPSGDVQEMRFCDFSGSECYFAVYQYPEVDTPAHRQLVLERTLLPGSGEQSGDGSAFAVYCWTGRYVPDLSFWYGLVSAHQFDTKECSKLLCQV